MGKEAQQERVMAEVPLGSKRSFSQQIEHLQKVPKTGEFIGAIG